MAWLYGRPRHSKNLDAAAVAAAYRRCPVEGTKSVRQGRAGGLAVCPALEGAAAARRLKAVLIL